MIEVFCNEEVLRFSSSVAGIFLKEKLARSDIIGFFNRETNEIYDLHSQIHSPAKVQPIFLNSSESLKILRPSAAIILASVLDAQIFEIGVNEDDSFFCKFRTNSGHSVSEHDFEKITKDMLIKIDQSIDFERIIRSCKDSIEISTEYNTHLIQDGPNSWFKFDDIEVISNYPCLKNSNECSKYFLITKIAGEQIGDLSIQKITGVIFHSQAALDEYLESIELARKHDHRLIGQAQELFHITPEAAGSIFWLPKGWELYRSLQDYMRLKSYQSYQEVRTPFVMSSVFWEKSGHMKAFRKNMMLVNMGGDEGHEEAALKPMNCPGHVEIFKTKIRSYRDLPLRLAEFGSCHRYEPSGSLHGLMRVRSFTQDDGHIFCTIEQIKSEVKDFMKQALAIYEDLGFEDPKIIISTRPDGFLGEAEKWDFAEKELEVALEDLGLSYTIAVGEGAFYGPKIELQVKDALKRSWQLGTIQLDFVLPVRLGAFFVDSDGEKKNPCILHRAIFGSIERFIGVFLEHTGGKLPIRFAPVQAVVCSVVSDVIDYAALVTKNLKDKGLRITLDDRSEKLGYKVREHRLAKIPALITIGKDEMSNKTITVEYNNEKKVFAFADIDSVLRFLNEKS